MHKTIWNFLYESLYGEPSSDAIEGIYGWAEAWYNNYSVKTMYRTYRKTYKNLERG